MIAFVAAERLEFSGLLRHLRNARRIDCAARFALAGELNGEPVALAANGPGPVLAGLAADALLEGGNVQALVSYGLCGALDPALAVGDVFVATEVRGGAGAINVALQPKHTPRPVASGSLLSIDRVACTVEEKAELAKTGAYAIEMEAAAVALRACRAGVPFYCVRVVSDGAAQSLALDFNQMRDADGRFSRARILAAAMRDPLKLVPELIAYGRKSRRAAQTLGDFIASCRI